MGKASPIKRSKAIAELSRDHHFVLLLVWKIREGLRKTIEPERITRYILYFFDTELFRHLKDEEKYLYDIIPSDNEIKIRAEVERKKIYAMLEYLRNNPADADTLRNYAEILEKHVRFEERELFDFFQHNASEADLLKISTALQAREHEDESIWEDAFWK